MTGVEWATTHGDRVEVYHGQVLVHGFASSALRGQIGWRYRVVARNSQIVEMGSESYTRRRNAVRAALRHHPRVES